MSVLDSHPSRPVVCVWLTVDCISLRLGFFGLFFCISMYIVLFFFFFSSRRRHTRCLSDWSSDVCSSDLADALTVRLLPRKFGDDGPIGVAAQPGQGTVQLDALACLGIDFEEDGVAVGPGHAREEERRRLTVEQRADDVAAQRTFVRAPKGREQVVHVVGDVARDLGLAESQPPELVGRRVGEEQDRLGEGLVERRGAGEPLQFGLLGQNRGRECEPPLSSEHRPHGATADGGEKIESPPLKTELAGLAAQDQVIDLGHPSCHRRELHDFVVAVEVVAAGTLPGMPHSDRVARRAGWRRARNQAPGRRRDGTRRYSFVVSRNRRSRAPRREESIFHAMDDAAKKTVLRHFPYGLYALTVRHDGEEHGMTANWVAEAAFEPPMVAVAVENTSKTIAMIRDAHHFAVNLLQQGQRELAGKLGRASTSAPHKLKGIKTKPAPASGAPILADALGWVECRVVATLPSGDHTLVLVAVSVAGVEREGRHG